MTRLFHISEEDNIDKFIPRKSTALWNYESYVWAISDRKLHNYLLPRQCPRVCVSLKKQPVLEDWLPPETIQHKSAVIFVPDRWKATIQSCTLHVYEFNETHFELMNEIAGYYVSCQTEVPIGKVAISNCVAELTKRKVELIITDDPSMLAIREEVENTLTDFSIIRWRNFDKP